MDFRGCFGVGVLVCVLLLCRMWCWFVCIVSDVVVFYRDVDFVLIFVVDWCV